MNPIDMIKQFIGGGGTPEQFLTQKIIGNNMNPMINNLIQMLQRGDDKSVEQFAINICKERGIDYPKKFAEFMSNMKR